MNLTVNLELLWSKMRVQSGTLVIDQSIKYFTAGKLQVSGIKVVHSTVT